MAEAFARALARSGSIRDPIAWIYRTAFRLANDELRAERRRGAPAADAETPKPELSGLIDALRKLSPNQRAAIVLRHVLVGGHLRSRGDREVRHAGAVDVPGRVEPRDPRRHDGGDRVRLWSGGGLEAPPGTPIEVTGDLETVNASASWRAPGTVGPSTDQVADAEPGTLVTYSYEVTWADGSEASCWLLLTVEGDAEQPSATRPEFVIRFYGIGSGRPKSPPSPSRIGARPSAAAPRRSSGSSPKGRRVMRTTRRGARSIRSSASLPDPIVMIADTALDIVRSRTTTPFYGGPNAVGASVRWPEGHAEFLVPFEVDATGFTPPEIELVCAADDRLPFTHPGGGVILPGGSSFITGNLVGFQPLDVVEQTRKADGETEWSGIWQVVRDGEVVATVDWDSLNGTACRGSGIGGA